MMNDQHLLQYGKAVVYLPNPERSHPHILDEWRSKAAEDPPHPVPFHCKPWVDGQTAGWTLFYGFLTEITIVGTPEGRIVVENGDQLFAEAKVIRQIESFAPGFFSFSTGYRLKTQPGMVSLLIPPTNPPDGWQPLTAVVETDWYPKEIFLACRAPAAGAGVTLRYGDALARVVVIPRPDQLRAEPLDDAGTAELVEREACYREEERTTDSVWTAATGDQFTHLYKQWSRAHRKTLRERGIE